MKLTVEQIEAVKKGDPVRISMPEIGKDVVLLRAEDYEEIREALDDERARRALAQAGLEAASHWAHDNPF